jgi:hypothetical protein
MCFDHFPAWTAIFRAVRYSVDACFKRCSARCTVAMSQLNATANEWRPPGAEAAPAAGGTHWETYAPGDEYADDSDDDNDSDGHMAWAQEQAQLAEEARMRGRTLPDPRAPDFHHAPTHAPAPYSTASSQAPRLGHTVTVGPRARLTADDDAASVAPSYGPAETTMSTATSIQVGVAVARATGKEKRRNYAKEAAKEQRRRVIAEKSGLEAFSAALLHSVSPFMAPLRERTGSSLPHLKLDQRFGKRGQPQTGVMQFVIAPVVNYRPAHYHDLAPGDVMEYHFDLAQILRVIGSAHRISISYGSEWKPFSLPYAYLSCREYKDEVRRLCPDETPNSKSDAMYEDDIVKDVTKLILAVPELEVFKRKSFVSAMKSRSNLYPMYAVFASLFSEISNYQIQISDLTSVPPRFMLKTSKSALDSSAKPIKIAGSADIWEVLPAVTNPLHQASKPAPTLPEAFVDEDEETSRQSPNSMSSASTFVAIAAVATCLAALAVVLAPSKGRRR